MHVSLRNQRPHVAFGAALLLMLAGVAQPATAGDQNRLDGAWSVVVTQRACDTGAPQAVFTSLVTFHDGGTLSESTGSLAFAPNQRSDGTGAWHRLSAGRFKQQMVALMRFTTGSNLPTDSTFDPTKPVTPGFKAGSQTITQVVRLTGRDSYESEGTTAFFESASTTPYRTGCATAVGTRIR